VWFCAWVSRPPARHRTVGRDKSSSRPVDLVQQHDGSTSPLHRWPRTIRPGSAPHRAPGGHDLGLVAHAAGRREAGKKQNDLRPNSRATLSPTTSLPTLVTGHTITAPEPRRRRPTSRARPRRARTASIRRCGPLTSSPVVVGVENLPRRLSGRSSLRCGCSTAGHHGVNQVRIQPPSGLCLDGALELPTHAPLPAGGTFLGQVRAASMLGRIIKDPVPSSDPPVPCGSRRAVDSAGPLLRLLHALADVNRDLVR